MEESLLIEDGPGFGELLRKLRWQRGLTEKNLAQGLQEAFPKALPLKSWIMWVKQAEEGLIESVDGDRVLAAVAALEVPVSALMPATRPASPEEVGPTTREQLLAFGMSEEEARAFCSKLDIDLDGHGPIIACSPNAELESVYWTRKSHEH